MSNKYSEEMEQQIIAAVSSKDVVGYVSQKHAMLQLARECEYTEKELSAKLRHMAKSNDKIQCFYLPKYETKKGEKPRSKALLVSDLEALTGLELESLVNANRQVIVDLLDFIKSHALKAD